MLTDDNQQVVWETEYTPFGEANITVEHVVNNLRFPGQYLDSETNLHYNYFRYYDPSVGRYITSDPIGIMGLLTGSADRVAMDPTIPPAFAALQDGMPYQIISRNKPLNTYRYAANSPLLYTDPLGLDATATLGRGLVIWGGASAADGPIPAGEIVGGVIFLGYAGYALYEYCTDNTDDREAQCEKLLEVDTSTCNGITRTRGAQAGAACHASATQRYAACLRGSPLPPLNTWNN